MICKSRYIVTPVNASASKSFAWADSLSMALGQKQLLESLTDIDWQIYINTTLHNAL